MDLKKLFICLIASFSIFIVLINFNDNTLDINDSLKFKEEYENISNDNIEYKKLTISENNPMIYLNENEYIDFLNSMDGILYIGTPYDNNCRDAVEILLRLASQNNITKIYYIDKNLAFDTNIDLSEYDLSSSDAPLVIFRKNNKLINIYKENDFLNDDDLEERISNDMNLMFDDLCSVESDDKC